MKELNKCYLIDNKYIIINYTSSKKIKYDNEKKIDRIINDGYYKINLENIILNAELPELFKEYLGKSTPLSSIIASKLNALALELKMKKLKIKINNKLKYFFILPPHSFN